MIATPTKIIRTWSIAESGKLSRDLGNELIKIKHILESGCGKAELCVVCRLPVLWHALPEFRQIFTGNFQDFTGVHQNFARTSNWSTLNKGIATTRPSHSSYGDLDIISTTWISENKNIVLVLNSLPERWTQGLWLSFKGCLKSYLLKS